MLLPFLAALWAGTQNALAGGGSFITFPALLPLGMDARAANITSTIALFPGQLTTGWAGRRSMSAAASLSFRALVAISLVGGAAGAPLLLATPASFFAALVPWLVLFATVVFAWGGFGRPAATVQADGMATGRRPMRPWATRVAQFAIAVFGGYFGGGIGFLMLAVLTLAGLPTRQAGRRRTCWPKS